MLRVRDESSDWNGRYAPLLGAVRSAGAHCEELPEAIQARIATAMSDPECPPVDLASLIRLLQKVMAEIDRLKEAAPASEAGSTAPVKKRSDAFDSGTI